MHVPHFVYAYLVLLICQFSQKLRSDAKPFHGIMTLEHFITAYRCCTEDINWTSISKTVDYSSLTFPYPIGVGEDDGDSSVVAVIAGGVSGGVAVIVAIAAVVTGVLCYCHSRRQKNKPTTQQPEAMYEEIPGEAQGATEMKENTAYGPVTPRGGPVYEVPGWGAVPTNRGILVGGNAAHSPVTPRGSSVYEVPGWGAVPTNRGILVGENAAYGPVTPRGGPEYEVANEGIVMGGNAAYDPVTPRCGQVYEEPNEGIEMGGNAAYGQVYH